MQWTQNDLVCELNYRKKIYGRPPYFDLSALVEVWYRSPNRNGLKLRGTQCNWPGEFLNAKAIVETIQEILSIAA